MMFSGLWNSIIKLETDRQKNMQPQPTLLKTNNSAYEQLHSDVYNRITYFKKIIVEQCKHSNVGLHNVLHNSKTKDPG